MSFKGTIIAGALCAALATAGHATMLPYKSFDSLVAESEGVVVATVSKVESVPGLSPGDQHTFVTFDHLDVLRGQVEGSVLTLRLRGGFDSQKGVGLHVDGAPEFALGERVLLFVQGNGRDLVPFVGWSQGVFKLVKDQQGNQVVHDAEGHPVVGIERGHVMRRAGDKLDSAIAGAPAVVRARSATPAAHGGITENGSAVVQVDVSAAPAPAMRADRFIAAVRERPGQGLTLRSTKPQDNAIPESAGRDAAPSHVTKSPHPVANPSGNSVAEPAQRKAPGAREQR